LAGLRTRATTFSMGTVPPPKDDRRRLDLRDVLARIEWALEAIGDGETGAAVAVLLDLRDELLGVDLQEHAAWRTR
jgi:hypothetical protein